MNDAATDPADDLRGVAEAGFAGEVYMAGAVVLGVGLVGMTVLDLTGKRWTRRLFAYSLVYVALLFGLFAISPFLP